MPSLTSPDPAEFKVLGIGHRALGRWGSADIRLCSEALVSTLGCRVLGACEVCTPCKYLVPGSSPLPGNLLPSFQPSTFLSLVCICLFWPAQVTLWIKAMKLKLCDFGDFTYKLNTLIFVFKIGISGTWMSLLVKRLPSAQFMILGS